MPRFPSIRPTVVCTPACPNNGWQGCNRRGSWRAWCAIAKGTSIGRFSSVGQASHGPHRPVRTWGRVTASRSTLIPDLDAGDSSDSTRRTRTARCFPSGRPGLFGAVRGQGRQVGGRYIARARGAFTRQSRSQRFLPGGRRRRVEMPHNFGSAGLEKWLPVASCQVLETR